MTTTTPKILLEAGALEPDVQTRIVCPFCQGGSSGERCMSIVRTSVGEVKFICHRAKCGIAGRCNTSSLVEDEKPPQPSPPAIERKLSLRTLTQAERDRIFVRWGVRDVPFWRWDETSDRLAMPVYGWQYEMRGMVLRALDKRTPKVLSVKMREDVPLISWYIGKESGPLLLVEDMISAQKTYDIFGYWNVVALNGTHIGDDIIRDIVAFAGPRAEKRIVLALDEDASVLALDYARQFELIFGQIKVVLLDRDLKNMENKEIVDCLLNVL